MTDIKTVNFRGETWTDFGEAMKLADAYGISVSDAVIIISQSVDVKEANEKAAAKAAE